MGESVKLSVAAEKGIRVTLRLWWNDHEILHPMQENDGLYTYTLHLPETCGLLWYFFILESDTERLYLGNARDNLGGAGELYAWEPPSFQITVYDRSYDPPHFLRDGIMYQIMPDRFCAVDKVPPHDGWLHEDWHEPPTISIDPKNGDNRADDFFGGNLRGIRSKLDYLKELGISVIYLNPIFYSPSNHKYNTGDYSLVDPSFGTNDELEALCREAAGHGIRILLDGVFSHTGSDSRYFNKYGHFDSVGAYQRDTSPYYDWYTFKGSRDEYECWWGFDTLPNVNELSPGFLDYIVTGKDAIAPHYIRRGTSGWRLDVAGVLPMEFLRLLRKSVKSADPNAALIGEVWEDASNKVAYNELRCYCLGNTLDSVMNYPLRDGVIDFFLFRLDAYALKRRLDSLYENYPRPFALSLMNLLGSHDKARIINRLSGVEPEEKPRSERRFEPLTKEQFELGKRRFLKAWELVCALPGIPCLYYSDEAGAQGGDDPFCRGTYPWGREDRDLLESVRRINLERRSSAPAKYGTLSLTAEDADTLTVRRTHDGQTFEKHISRK